VNYARVDTLTYLGNYLRRLPVSMARMMENALDWEHLPYVHNSSFAALECVESGKWGWRARALPAGQAQAWQLLELLLDSERCYWATSVIEGPAASVEIHTQATEIGPGEIEVDVRFYSSAELSEEESALYREVLQQQYARLYDEDERLMCGRQSALDDRRQRSASPTGSGDRVLVGMLEALSRDESHTVETLAGRFCLRFYDGAWVAHAAVCPHMLGPLDGSPVSAEGVIACPWHGYQFHVVTGHSVDGKCRGLAQAPKVQIEGNSLYVVVESTS